MREINAGLEAIQLRRRGCTVQERRSVGPANRVWPDDREWTQWKTVFRGTLESQADTVIARRVAEDWAEAHPAS